MRYIIILFAINSYFHLNAQNPSVLLTKYTHLIEQSNSYDVIIDGKPYLHFLIDQLDTTRLFYALENKADANIQDQGGNTCLHYIITKNHPTTFPTLEIIMFRLIGYEADILKKNNYGKTPMEVSIERENLEFTMHIYAIESLSSKYKSRIENPLQIAARSNNIKMTVDLYNNYNFLIKEEDSLGVNPVTEAFASGAEEIFNKLYSEHPALLQKEYKGDSIYRFHNVFGNSLLHVACENRNKQLFDSVINKIDPNQPNIGLQTPLHSLFDSFSEEELPVVKYMYTKLMQQGANLNLKQEDMNTPFSLFCRSSQKFNCLRYDSLSPAYKFYRFNCLQYDNLFLDMIRRGAIQNPDTMMVFYTNPMFWLHAGKKYNLIKILFQAGYRPSFKQWDYFKTICLKDSALLKLLLPYMEINTCIKSGDWLLPNLDAGDLHSAQFLREIILGKSDGLTILDLALKQNTIDFNIIKTFKKNGAKITNGNFIYSLKLLSLLYPTENEIKDDTIARQIFKNLLILYYYDKNDKTEAGACIAYLLENKLDPNYEWFDKTSDSLVLYSSPLHEALRNSDYQLIENLLKHGADPNFGKNLRLPLMLAVDKNDNYLIDLLIKYGADINLHDNLTGYTAAELAFIFGYKGLYERLKEMQSAHIQVPNISMCSFLSQFPRFIPLYIEKGGEVDIYDEKGNSLYKNIVDSIEHIQGSLRKRFAQYPNWIKPIETRELHTNIGKNLDYLLELIKRTHLKVDLGKSNSFGYSLLEYALHYKKQALLEFLLSNHVDPNIQLHPYKTAPLHWACLNNDESLIQLLIKSGANPAIPDSFNLLPLAYLNMPFEGIPDSIKEVFNLLLSFDTISTELLDYNIDFMRNNRLFATVPLIEKAKMLGYNKHNALGNEIQKFEIDFKNFLSINKDTIGTNPWLQTFGKELFDRSFRVTKNPFYPYMISEKFNTSLDDLKRQYYFSTKLDSLAVLHYTWPVLNDLINNNITWAAKQVVDKGKAITSEQFLTKQVLYSLIFLKENKPDSALFCLQKGLRSWSDISDITFTVIKGLYMDIEQAKGNFEPRMWQSISSHKDSASDMIPAIFYAYLNSNNFYFALNILELLPDSMAQKNNDIQNFKDMCLMRLGILNDPYMYYRYKNKGDIFKAVSDHINAFSYVNSMYYISTLNGILENLKLLSYRFQGQQGPECLYDLELLLKSAPQFQSKYLKTTLNKANPTDREVLSRKIEKFKNIEDPVVSTLQMDSIKMFVKAKQIQVDDFRPAKWEEIRNKLSDNSVAIEFTTIVNYDTLYAFNKPVYNYYALVLRNNFSRPKVFQLAGCSELDTLLNQLLFKNNESTFKANLLKLYNSSGLYEKFWKPFEKELKPNDSVFYCPSDFLGYINFAALKNTFGEYLVNVYNLNQVSSTANILDYSSKTTYLESNDQLLLAGNFYFRSDTTELKKSYLNPSYTSKKVEISVKNRTMSNKLKYAIAEEMPYINALAKQKTVACFQMKHYVFENHFIKQLAQNQYSFIHLNTHGLYDPLINNKSILYEPTNIALKKSYLAFTPADLTLNNQKIPAPITGNGLLNAYDISKRYFGDIKLCFINSCSSMAGQVLSAYTGVTSMATAWQSAGAQNVIVTLSPVGNITSLHFTKPFYKKLFEGKSIPEAFSETQRELSRNPKVDFTVWAPYLLVR